jgi:hypothetical protein
MEIRCSSTIDKAMLKSHSSSFSEIPLVNAIASNLIAICGILPYSLSPLGRGSKGGFMSNK